MKVTITNINGDRERVNLPKPHFETEKCGESDFTGVWITALFSGPRTGRRFVETYSIWTYGTAGCVGTTYDELSESEYLEYCEKVGTEPVNVEAVEV